MRNKIPKTILVIACLAVSLAQPLHGQDTGRIGRIERSARARAAIFGLAPDPAENLLGGQYPPQTLEDLRVELLNLADTVQEFAPFIPHGRFNSDSLLLARAQIEQMPLQTIQGLRKVIDPARLHARLQYVHSVLEKYSKDRPGATLNRNIANLAQLPLAPDSPFPDPKDNASESCISVAGTNTADATSVTRYPTAVVLAADLTWQTADSVRELAQDACKEDVVIAGEGGNTSLVCTVVDGVWIAAKFVDFAIHFCDQDLTGAVTDASYLRLGAINDEIGTLQGSVNSVSSQVSSADTHISNEIAALDAKLTALLAALSVQVANVQSSVDVANQRLLKSIATETQIMKLELTPDGSRILVPSILTCTGSNCPTNLLANCTGPGGACTWNHVGPLP